MQVIAHPCSGTQLATRAPLCFLAFAAPSIDPFDRNGGQVLLRRQQCHEGEPGAHAPLRGRGGGARQAGDHRQPYLQAAQDQRPSPRRGVVGACASRLRWPLALRSARLGGPYRERRGPDPGLRGQGRFEVRGRPGHLGHGDRRRGFHPRSARQPAERYPRLPAGRGRRRPEVPVINTLTYRSQRVRPWAGRDVAADDSPHRQEDHVPAMCA